MPPKEAWYELVCQSLNSNLRLMSFLNQFKRVLPLEILLAVFLFHFESDSLLLNWCGAWEGHCHFWRPKFCSWNVEGLSFGSAASTMALVFGRDAGVGAGTEETTGAVGSFAKRARLLTAFYGPLMATLGMVGVGNSVIFLSSLYVFRRM